MGDAPHRHRAAVIAAEVAERHGLSVADIRGRSRRAPLVRARWEAMRRTLNETDLTVSQVARWFRRDESTVRHAVRKGARTPDEWRARDV